MHRPPLASLPEPFPERFRALLPVLAAVRGRLDTGRLDRLRARRVALSRSGTFVGHRRYERGDDLRHLDWSAYARTGSLFTKQLEDEERRAWTLLLDPSPRLLVGKPPRRVGMLRLAAVLGAIALVQLDGVAVVVPGSREPCARFVGAAQLGRLLQFLREMPTHPVAPAAAVTAVRAALPGEAIGRLHWLSDFARPQAFAEPLRRLRRRGVRVTGWLPTIGDDDAPMVGGFVRVQDPDDGRELDVPVDRALHDELRRQLRRLAATQRRMCAEAGAQLVRWPFMPAELEQPTLRAHLSIVAACSR